MENKKYKVLPIAITGKGKAIYYAGDIVTADMLATPVEQLIKGKYIAEIVADVKPEIPIAQDAKPAKKATVKKI
jgi:hypothetical protein